MKFRLAWRWAPLVLLAVVAADQLLKALVVHASGRLPLKLIGPVKLEIVHNTGISFSRFSGGGDVLLAAVAVVTVLVAALLFVLPRRYSPALTLILAGSIGNLIDRVRLGYVVDYLSVSVWPTFNLADVAIVAGALLLALRLLTVERA
jgi:signal peptidase II